MTRSLLFVGCTAAFFGCSSEGDIDTTPLTDDGKADVWGDSSSSQSGLCAADPLHGEEDDSMETSTFLGVLTDDSDDPIQVVQGGSTFLFSSQGDTTDDWFAVELTDTMMSSLRPTASLTVDGPADSWLQVQFCGLYVFEDGSTPDGITCGGASSMATDFHGRQLNGCCFLGVMDTTQGAVDLSLDFGGLGDDSGTLYLFVGALGGPSAALTCWEYELLVDNG